MNESSSEPIIKRYKGLREHFRSDYKRFTRAFLGCLKMVPTKFNLKILKINLKTAKRQQKGQQNEIKYNDNEC